MQTEEYIPISLSQPEQNITLQHPVYFSSEKEIGIVECRLPQSIGNITQDDYIKLAVHKKYPRKYLRLIKGKPLHEKLNIILEENGYKSSVQYEEDHFVASIDPKYFLVISEALAADLGLPKKLIGVIRGRPVPKHFTSDM